MNFLENITFRRKRTKSDSINQSSSGILSETIDETTTSLPDISNEDIDQTARLNQRIQELELELVTAHKEIETLSLENNELKRTNTDLLKKNELLVTISSSPAKSKMTPKNKSQTRATRLRMDLPKTCTTPTHNQQKTRNKSSEEPSTSSTHIQRKPPKICILSCNKYNKVRSIAEDTLNSSKLCHYLTPNGNVREIIKGIDMKLADFTMEDYCLILIGEEDFKKTDEYLSIITDIREKIEIITKTNIIICLPTMRHCSGTIMYNYRVQTFNDLLYQDIITHKYAHIYDPNDDLNKDRLRFFNRNIGKINNRGMKEIFTNVQKQIINIQHLNGIYGPVSNTSRGLEVAEDAGYEHNQSQSLFFRDTIYPYSTPKHCRFD